MYTLEPGPALRAVPLPEDVDPWCWHVCVRLPLHAAAAATDDAGAAAAASSSSETTAAREYTPLNPPRRGGRCAS